MSNIQSSSPASRGHQPSQPEQDRPRSGRSYQASQPGLQREVDIANL